MALLVWVATNPEGPVADDGISRTAVNADDPAEMFSFVPTTELSRLASDLEAVRRARRSVDAARRTGAFCRNCDTGGNALPASATRSADHYKRRPHQSPN